ncbi:hypothetical protein QFC20_004212 [Naganishia adeliensis]|uniref:Uncharacterized protein n=1 Tax=Naganishia adeliensis TaxID=92952 RepID=A0ACC2W2P6_9TREE|nr:hypothetical protein QFC20_004212 [Naganishia adeliensis]
MSDLIITTGHEDLYQQTGSVISAWNSTVSGSGATDRILQEVQQWSYNQPSDDLASSHTPTNATPCVTHAVPSISPPAPVASVNEHITPGSQKNPPAYTVSLPLQMPTRLSALSPVFVPRQYPVRLDDGDYTGETRYPERAQVGVNGEKNMNHRYQIYSILLSSSSDNFVDISSAATDEDLFTYDDYESKGSLKDPAQFSLVHEKLLSSSDSGMFTNPKQKRLPIESKEEIQTTRTLSPFMADMPYAKEPLSKSSLTVPGEWFPSIHAENRASLDIPEALTLRSELQKQLVELTSQMENQTGRVGLYGESLEDAPANWNSPLPVSAPKSQSFGTNRRHEMELIACDTCRTVDKLYTRTRMSPCGHLACFLCLTASINIVGASGTMARCTCCHQIVLDFSPGQKNHRELAQAKNTVDAILKALQPAFTSPGHVSADFQTPYQSTPVIMRIDNVAWDATPDMVEQFLPPGVLADTVQPVHLLIVREDGRSRDYLSKIQKLRVKFYSYARMLILGTGSRARPVTITLSNEEALIKELRPRSRAEMLGLLELCHTAISRNIGHDDYTFRDGGVYASVPNSSLNAPSSGMARLRGGSPLNTGKYLKSRYAPFWSVLSLASRLTTGHEVYWDTFHVVAGVISILAKHLPSLPATVTSARVVRFDQDRVQDRGNVKPRSSTWQLSSNGYSEGLFPAHSTLPETASQADALNAKIRKKLEEETARAKEQDVRARNRKVIDAGGPEACVRRDWTRSDAKMLQKFVEVFESQFGVQVNLKQTA